MAKVYPEFARLLAHYLAEEDRTASWLARELGVAASTVGHWLNDLWRPDSPERVIAICHLLRVYERQARQALLEAAGYGYSEVAPSRQVAPRPDSSGAAPRPFMVPPLPVQGVVGRTSALREIYRALHLETMADGAIPPLALRGMGGIGKTTLTIALGRQPDIPALFPDGVFWIALGPNPTLRLLLEQWGRALSLDLLPERDEAACQARLQSAFHHLRALLLVDDVWEVTHGRYFMVGGPQCRTLLTTRESPVAHALAARERTLRVDVLEPTDALLLLSRLAPEAVAATPRDAGRLCERLEYLPLALTLAGRFLANESDVPSRMQRMVGELIERRDSRLQLLQAEGRLGLDEDNPVSLQAILGMSVDRLSMLERERFAMLAVFGSEPLTWDLQATAAVWDCSIPEAEVSLSSLIQRGLVERRADAYWMHALLGDYASELMDEMQL